MKRLMRWGPLEIIKGALGVLGFLTLGLKLGCYSLIVDYLLHLLPLVTSPVRLDGGRGFLRVFVAGLP
jgi:hypothetical protein